VSTGGGEPSGGGSQAVDPELERLAAETRAFNAELERQLATMPPVQTLPPEESRRARREGRGIFPAPVYLPQARNLEVDGPAGPVRLRVIAPEGESAGTYLHIHGGGWTLGDNDMQDPRLARIARETRLTVVSVGYRLAPEHPYPAGPDDCEAAALWLLGQAGSREAREEGAGGGQARGQAGGREARGQAGGGPARGQEVGGGQARGQAGGRELVGDGPLVIGGDSAGAHLAVVTLLRLRDRHRLGGAFAAAVLEYGGFDLSLTPSQRLWGERNLVLSTPLIRWFGDQFLPGHDLEQRRHPDISPLYADLTGLPPAIFTVGTQDPLLDDTLFMEARWRAAGNRSELRIWPEAPHGFISLPMRAADLALSAQHEFVRRTLGLR